MHRIVPLKHFNFRRRIRQTQNTSGLLTFHPVPEICGENSLQTEG